MQIDPVKPLMLGQKIVHLEETDSTNKELFRLLDANPELEEGTTVIADRQRAGRGRLGRHWHTAAEALACSILLKPDTSVEKLSTISLVAAVAVHHAIHPVVPSATIKWPNDILVGQKKVCGILTESRISSANAHRIVLGIGLNIQSPDEGWPTDITQAACSINDFSDQTISRDQCADAILTSLNLWYTRWLHDGFAPIRDTWTQAHAHAGQRITVQTAQQQWTGIAMGLNHHGALLLKTEHGVQEIICGEVSNF